MSVEIHIETSPRAHGRLPDGNRLEMFKNTLGREVLCVQDKDDRTLLHIEGLEEMRRFAQGILKYVNTCEERKAK